MPALLIFAIGIFALYLSSGRTTLFTPQDARNDLVSNSKALADFLRDSGGVDMRPDPENDPTDLRYLQRRFIAFFQRTWNTARGLGATPQGTENLTLRVDGIWDDDTARAFRGMNGFIPPQKYGTVSGYR